MSIWLDEKTTARTREPVRAVVCAGEDETEYLRAGSGAVVVLLAAEHDGPGALELIALLSAAFLVITPKVPRIYAEKTLGGWLSNTLDGLGVARASILAEVAFMADVMRFAAEDEGRVHRVALLTARLDGASMAQYLA